MNSEWDSHLDGLQASLQSDVNRQSLAYWRDKRGRKLMPARTDIDPQEMRSFLSHIVLIDVLRQPLDFRYRLMGTTVTYHTIADHTGRKVSELSHQRPPSRFWDACEAVSGGAGPRTGGLPYVGPHRGFVSVEDIFMPLSADGENVDLLFVTVDFFRKTRP